MFSANTANEIWVEAASTLKSKGISEQTSRLGNTRELLHANLYLQNPRNRWVYSRQPAINPAFAIVEVIWILSGRNDAAFLNHWFAGLPEYQGDDDKYHGAYGHRLQNHFGINQLDRAYAALISNPDTRQVVLQMWDPEADLPLTDGSPASKDIPCNICSMPKIRDGSLEWLQVMRSNDINRGLPFNIIQFTMLQEVIAGWLGLKLGGYHHLSDSLHMYDSDIEEFYINTNVKDVLNEDSIALPKNESDNAIQEMERIFEYIVYEDYSPKKIMQLCSSANLPESYLNLLFIAVADSARRQGWSHEAKQLPERCKNKALVYAWDNWAARFESK